MVGRSVSSSSPRSCSTAAIWSSERGMARVDDVQQHVRLGQLLERGLERRHELVRQLPDEADGVGEDEGVRVARR